MSYETTAIAMQFREQFNNGEIAIKDFDMFIIDTGMVLDPGTEVRDDPRHKAFIRDRNNAKRALNAAGSRLSDGRAFMVDVVKAGHTYQVKPLTNGAIDAALDYGAKVRLRSDNQFAELKKLGRKIASRLEEDRGNPELLNALKKIQYASKVGNALQVQVTMATKLFDELVQDAKTASENNLLGLDG